MYWSNNIADSIPFVPQVSGNYVLTGASPEGCVATDTVFVSVNDASSNTIVAVGIDSYTLNGQTYTASGTYTQILTNASGCDSLITLELSLDFTSFEENKANEFKVYPNPVNDLFFIASNPSNIGAQLMLVDAFGRIVLKEVIDTQLKQINLQEFTNGICTIRLGSETKRIEVLR